MRIRRVAACARTEIGVRDVAVRFRFVPVMSLVPARFPGASGSGLFLRKLLVTVSNHQLPAVESLCVTAGCIAFHPAQPQEREEGVFPEPAPASL